MAEVQKLNPELINKAINSAQIAYSIISDNELKKSILAVYSGILGQLNHGTGIPVIENNIDVLLVLASPAVTDTIYLILNQTDTSSIEYADEIPGLLGNGNDNISSILKSKYKTAPLRSVTVDDITKALQKYVAAPVTVTETSGMDTINPENLEDKLGVKFDDDLFNDGYFADESDRESDSELGEQEEDPGEPEKYEEDDPDFRITEEELQNQSQTVQEPTQEVPVAQQVQQPEPQTESQQAAQSDPQSQSTPEAQSVNEDDSGISTEAMISDKERLEDLKYNWEPIIKLAVSEVLASYKDLYQSGYSGVSFPAGILTNAGIMRGFADGKIGFAKDRNRKDNTGIEYMDRPFSITLYDNILDSLEASSKFKRLQDLSGNFSAGNELTSNSMLPEYVDASTFVYFNIHLRAMFGYYRMCKGLKAVAEKEGAVVTNSNGTTSGRPGKFKAIEKYLKSEIENVFYAEFLKAGLDKADIIDPRAKEAANKILDRVSTALLNVVAVTEYNHGVSAEIRICSKQPINVDGFLAKSKGIVRGYEFVKVKNNPKTHVLIIRAILDAEKANSASLFAYEALDGIIQSGQIPQWSHALLGKTQDGSPFFWDDFVTDTVSKKVYCIYAASRAGKGIMTSTLITNILANGLPLFYMDGKPENGVGLGKIAWTKHKEAPIYNGFRAGSAPYSGYLEEYTSDMRSPSMIFSSEDKIPAGIFTKSEDKKVFMNICTYLRGMELFLNVVMARNGEGLDARTNSMIFIFDELKNTATQEEATRKIFKKYLESKGASLVGFSKVGIPKASDAGSDAGVQFIMSWFKWLDDMLTTEVTVQTIALGKAAVNAFFIFQGSSWMNSAEYQNTFITKFLLNLESTKIIGREGVSGNGGDGKYGDGNAVNYSWVQYINANPGSWAITHQASVRECGDVNKETGKSPVTIFKPFNVFLERDPSRPAPKDDRVFLKGYLDDLFGRLGIQRTPEDVLQSAFDYFNNFVVDHQMAPSLHEFMYNAHDFTLSGIDNKDYSGITLKDKESQGQAVPQTPNNLKAYDISPDGDRPIINATTMQKPINDGQPEQVQPQGQAPTQPQNQQAQANPWDLPMDQWGSFGAQVAQTQGQAQSQEQPFQQNPGVTPSSDQDIDQMFQDLQNGTMAYEMFNKRNGNQQAQQPYINPNPEIVVNNTASTVKETSTGGISMDANRESAEKMKLDYSNAVIVDTNGFRFKSVKNMLLNSFTGADYEFNSRWKHILKAVDKRQNRKTITTIIITDDVIICNNLQVHADGLVGGMDGVRVSDIVNFQETAKFFPNIKTMCLDTTTFYTLAMEYGNDKEVWFNMFSKLGTIIVKKRDGTDLVLQRTGGFNNKVSEELRRGLLMRQIDAISDSSNTSKDKSPLDVHRATRKMNSMRGTGWERCKNNFKKKNPVKGAFYGGATIALAVLTGGVGAVSGLIGAFSKRN